MDREMILSKSRQENANGGEYEKHTERLSETAATIVTVAALVFLIILAILRGGDILPYLFLMFVGGAAELTVTAIKKRSVGNAVGAVLLGILGIISLVQILCGNTFMVNVMWESFWQ